MDGARGLLRWFKKTDEVADGVTAADGHVDDFIDCIGGNSFSADTQVLMADHSTRAFREIEVGDMVWATDPGTGESGPREVLAVWPHEDLLFEFEVQNGSINTTEDHHFWNHTDQEWQETQNIDVGDQLLTPDGTTISAGQIDWQTAHWDTAYDLTINDYHTYYVAAGDSEVLVHNCGGVAPRALVNSAGRSYPDVIDPRTGSSIVQPPTNLTRVDVAERAPWGSQERGAFIKQWYDEGFDTPPGGWADYDVHHIVPREYGGTNVFENLVPVQRQIHQQEFNAWWRDY